jgi:hypothetical protein
MPGASTSAGREQEPIQGPLRPPLIDTRDGLIPAAEWHSTVGAQFWFHELGAVPGTAITTLDTSAPGQIGQSGRRPRAVAARAEEPLQINVRA